MPTVRIAHRAAPVRPAITHRSVNRPRPVAPRLLPILQPPTLFIQTNYIKEDEDEVQQPTEKTNRPLMVGHANRKKTTQQILTYFPQQNHSKRQLFYLPTRHIQYAQPKYSSNVYFAR